MSNEFETFAPAPELTLEPFKEEKEEVAKIKEK